MSLASVRTSTSKGHDGEGEGLGVVVVVLLVVLVVFVVLVVLVVVVVSVVVVVLVVVVSVIGIPMMTVPETDPVYGIVVSLVVAGWLPYVMLVTVPGGGAGASTDVELSDGVGLGVDEISSLEVSVVLNGSLEEAVVSNTEELLTTEVVGGDGSREVELSVVALLSVDVTTSVEEKFDGDGDGDKADVDVDVVVITKIRELLNDENTVVVPLTTAELLCDGVEVGGEGEDEGTLELLVAWVEEINVSRLDNGGMGVFELLTVSSMDVVSCCIEELDAELVGVATK